MLPSFSEDEYNRPGNAQYRRIPLSIEPEQPSAFLSIWPQSFFNPDCIAVISMDLMAPFTADMGLSPSGIGDLRATIREAIQKDPTVLVLFGANTTDGEHWLEALDGLLREQVSNAKRQEFWGWIRDVYTSVPADRPNWEMYETFFFEWSVAMRDDQDTAGCFADPRFVYEAYCAFVRARRLEQRIAESRTRRLSAWDKKIFSLCRYSLSEAEVNFDTIFDPFGVVDASAERNHFQEFWEYLLPQLTDGERDGLLASMRTHFAGDFRLPDMVTPAALRKSIR